MQPFTPVLVAHTLWSSCLSPSRHPVIQLASLPQFSYNIGLIDKEQKIHLDAASEQLVCLLAAVRGCLFFVVVVLSACLLLWT
jgi:hypothetical protein